MKNKDVSYKYFMCLYMVEISEIVSAERRVFCFILAINICWSATQQMADS